MFNFGCPDPMRQTAKSTMCCGMRVTTYHGHAWQSQALLRPDHMRDALTDIINIKFNNIKGLAVVIQSLYLDARSFIFNSGNALLTLFFRSRYVMIRCGNIRA